MVPNFKLSLAVPATQVSNAFSKIYTQSDQAVQSISVELKKEKGRLSYLEAAIRDPDLAAFGQLPDIAFFDVPTTLDIVQPGSTSIPVRAFDGKMTFLDGSWPEMDTQVVAHDKSIDMRRRAKNRTFHNRTSVQILQQIAAEYGLTVDSTSLGDVKLAIRSISIGHPSSEDDSMSDWLHALREIEADGLTVHTRGATIYVQQYPTNIYPTTFRPGDGKVIGLKVRISHVRGPGDLGNKTAHVAWDHSGSEKAVSGAAATEATSEKGGDARTHRRPVGGQASTNKGAHTEDVSGTKWENVVTKSRGRKDELTLTLQPTPSLYLTHLVPLSGWGGKIDGNWEVVSIRHLVVPSEGQQSTTTVSLTRGTSKGGAKQTGGIAFGYSGAK